MSDKYLIFDAQTIGNTIDIVEVTNHLHCIMDSAVR